MHEGDSTPTLKLSPENHALVNGSEKQMFESFTVFADAQTGTLKNTAPYASFHQFGIGVPRRPFVPVEEDGIGILTPYAEQQLQQILDDHFSFGLGSGNPF